MNTIERIVRHGKLTWKNLAFPSVGTPPFLILFINSICNLTCEHCFYWRNLNQRDDLKVEEIFALARDLGRIENLNLSGGEPFMRPEFAEICRFFIQNNGVEQIYVPTNGYFTERTINALKSIFEEKSLELFVCELSIDGMPEYHDRFRGNSKSFAKLLETYEALAEMQVTEPRLRIHSISTVTSENLDEIKRLTTYLYERCPAMDHHNLALIRGERKNQSLVHPRPASVRRALSIRAPALGAARRKALRLAGRADAAVGQGEDRREADASRSLPRRHHERRGLCQRRRQLLRDASSAGQYPPEELPRNLAFARRPKPCAAASTPRNAGAPTKSSCGRASFTSRRTSPKRCSDRAPGPNRSP